MFEFDNSYSWMKGKNISYDVVLFVPLEIKQKKKDPIKEVLFETGKVFANEMTHEAVLGWVDEN